MVLEAGCDEKLDELKEDVELEAGAEDVELGSSEVDEDNADEAA